VNKVFRTVWNAATATWVAAPETARSRSKGNRKVMGALVLSPALLAVTTAQGAATCAGTVCTGTDPTDSYAIIAPLSGDHTFKGTMEVLLTDASELRSGEHHLVQDSVKLVVGHDHAITGATVSLSNSAELNFRQSAVPSITPSNPASSEGHSTLWIRPS